MQILRFTEFFISCLILFNLNSCAQCQISPFDTTQGGVLGALIIDRFSNIRNSILAPTGLTGVSGNAQNTIAWNSVSEASSYNLYWSTTSGLPNATGNKISAVTSPYIHTGLMNGSTYFYIIISVNSKSESNASSQINLTPISPVAVASAGTVYYTLDDKTWTSKTIAGANTLSAVVYNGTNYVAVGGTGSACVAYYSSDGISWNQSTGFTCNSQLNDITFGKNLLVAVGGTTATATTYISTNNGVTFTVNSTANASAIAYTKIAHDGTYFVSGNGSNPPAIYRSTDGNAFVASPVSGLFGTSCTSPGYFGDIYNLPTTSRIIFVGASSGCANATVLANYTDNSATSWTSNAVNIFGGNTTPVSPNAIVLGGTRLVAIGQNCKTDYSDNPTGILSWNFNGTMTGCSAGTIWNSITYDGTKYIAVGVNGSGTGTIATSANGIPTSWTITSLGGGAINGVSWK